MLPLNLDHCLRKQDHDSSTEVRPLLAFDVLSSVFRLDLTQTESYRNLGIQALDHLKNNLHLLEKEERFGI